MPKGHTPSQHARELILDRGPEGFRIDEQRNDYQEQDDRRDHANGYLHPAFLHVDSFLRWAELYRSPVASHDNDAPGAAKVVAPPRSGRQVRTLADPGPVGELANHEVRNIGARDGGSSRRQPVWLYAVMPDCRAVD